MKHQPRASTCGECDGHLSCDTRFSYPQVVTSHVTHTGTGRHKGGGSRNRLTASPSYHGRRGATGRKTPTAPPGTAGLPHQVTQCHHIGSAPPHTGNRLDSHQCQRGTSCQSHKGHGAHPAHHSNRHWPPIDACRFHPHTFPNVPCGFPRGPFPHRCNSVLVFSAHHLEDGRDGDFIGLAVPEELCSSAAKMTPIDEPAAASEVTLPALASLWSNNVSIRWTALKNEELVRSKRGRTGALVTEQRRHRMHGAAMRGRSGTGAVQTSTTSQRHCA